MRDIFTDIHGQPRILLGASINSASSRTAELAARIGFDVIWIEMEHASADLMTAEAMCRAAQANGALPLVRTSGYRREQILHALEIGASIVVAPLVNDAETAREVVRHGKFRPIGERGYNTRSRAADFGLEPLPVIRMNAETYLFPQVETCQAVANVEGILAVEGIAGILIGPGDLSADLGCPGDFTNPALIDMTTTCIRAARAAGKHAGILVAPGPLLDAAIAAGADLCIIGSDFGAMIQVWRSQLERCQAAQVK
jgi:2-keto-3-deoxy-L-rhamnonate aldolase RhmA